MQERQGKAWDIYHASDVYVHYSWTSEGRGADHSSPMYFMLGIHNIILINKSHKQTKGRVVLFNISNFIYLFKQQRHTET